MTSVPQTQSPSYAPKIFWGFLLCLTLVLGGVVVGMSTDTQQLAVNKPAKQPSNPTTVPAKIPATKPVVPATPTTKTPASTTPPTSTTSSTPTSAILLSVPFTAQAPLGNWADQRQQAGCEEASALMAMLWVQGKKSISLLDAENQIIAISDWEQQTYGEYHDTVAKDTIARIFNSYFNYSNVELKENITIDDIKAELANGNLVIVPTNGQKLGNPNYVPPGPVEHNLVIRGYDPATKEFITNDSGTRHGEKYRYNENVLFGALQDYPTGNHEIILSVSKVMIIVKKAA